MRDLRDLVVVGGGPVGLATAIAARLAGLEVAVVEARRAPIDKACGEGLMPEAVAALSALGIETGDLGRPFHGIRYRSEERVADADFPGGVCGRGVRRTELHAALVARAAALGVELRFGERVEALTPLGVRSAAGEIAAARTVGADGLHSRVRLWAGLARDPVAHPAARGTRHRRRFGVRRHLRMAAPPQRVEVIFGRGAEAYLTPVDAEVVGVALLWSGPARGFDDLVASRFPAELGARFAGASVLSRDRGAGPFAARSRAVIAGRVALVGDAAGYLDALTGEGLAIGFGEARALASALAAGDLAGYARASAQLRRRPQAITRLALAMARRPRLRHRVVTAFAADPPLFAALLGALGCGGSLRDLGSAALLRFGARLLLPVGAVRT